MDPLAQYQQQNVASQNYAPSQVQAYDQPTQAHYLSHHQYNQAQQYPSYPNSYYSYQPNQQFGQEPISIHPPGVPIPPEPTHVVGPEQGFGQTHVRNQQISYYPQGAVEQQQRQLTYSDPGLQGQQWKGSSGEIGPMPLYPPTVQSQYSGAGRSGGRPPFRGRGRGRGRGGLATPVRPPPRMAWCELCRVDCNTAEILEKHKNGKKHKKNLKVHEELQTLAQERQDAQMAITEFKPEAASASALPEKVAVSEEQNPTLENLATQAVTEENKEGQVHGLKRKMRGGRGGKWMRTNEGSRKPVEPPKPKEIVPFICELCNVKCESPSVFDSHLKGKKHLFNLQRFQEHQATLGQAALQALYPALQALYPALLQALSQPNANASTSSATELDQQVLHWLQAAFPQAGPSMLPQGTASTQPSEMEPQVQQDSAIQASTAGGGTQEAPIQVAENSTSGGGTQEAEAPIQVAENSTSGGGTQEALIQVAENHLEPESKIEELDSKSAELAQ